MAIKRNKLPNLNQFKAIVSLKEAVSRQLEKHDFPADRCWQVVSIDISERDVEFSQWLEDAAKTYKILKKRGEFCLRSDG